MLRTNQKKAKMKQRGENEIPRIELEGKEIEEQEMGKPLGLTWSSNKNWKHQIDEISDRFRENYFSG